MAKSRTFHSASLPFEILTIAQYAKNTDAESAAMRAARAGTTVIDGFFLRPRVPP